MPGQCVPNLARIQERKRAADGPTSDPAVPSTPRIEAILAKDDVQLDGPIFDDEVNDQVIGAILAESDVPILTFELNEGVVNAGREGQAKSPVSA